MSWSGARSRAAAELLSNWTKCVIQATQPWISTRGIDRGALWFSTINDELKDTTVGIVCLTHENKNKPWILFEAGALAKGLANSRVCTFLVDLEPKDLQDPLAQFNHTLPTRDGVWSLVVTLNNSIATPLEQGILEQVFDTNWPQFLNKFEALLLQHPQEGIVEVRSNDSMLEEILASTRSLSQRLRAIENGKAIGPTWGQIRGEGALSNSVEQLSFMHGLKLFQTYLTEGLSIDMAIEKLVAQGIDSKSLNAILDNESRNPNSNKNNYKKFSSSTEGGAT